MACVTPGVLPNTYTKEVQDLLTEIDKYRKIHVRNKHVLECLNEVVFIDKAIPPIISKVNNILKRDYYFNRFNSAVPFLGLEESEPTELSNIEKIQLRVEVCKKIKSKCSMSHLKTSREVSLGACPMNIQKPNESDSMLGTTECLTKLIAHNQLELLNLKSDIHEHVEDYKEAIDTTIKILKDMAEWKHNKPCNAAILLEVERLEDMIRFLELTVMKNLATETPHSIAAAKTVLRHMKEDIRSTESVLADLKCEEAVYTNMLKTEEYEVMLKKYQALRKQTEYMKWAYEKFNN